MCPNFMRNALVLILVVIHCVASVSWTCFECSGSVSVRLQGIGISSSCNRDTLFSRGTTPHGDLFSVQSRCQHGISQLTPALTQTNKTPCIYHAKTTPFTNVPIPVIFTSIFVPGTRYLGGSRPAPTPKHTSAQGPTHQNINQHTYLPASQS